MQQVPIIIIVHVLRNVIHCEHVLIIAARMDYDPIIEIVTFLPEDLTKSVSISIKDDTNVEFDESFFLYLVSGEGVHLSPFSRAEVVKRNDDGKNCNTYPIPHKTIFTVGE